MTSQQKQQSLLVSNNEEGSRDATTTIPPVPWAWVKAVNDILANPPFKEPDLPVPLLPWLYLSDEYNSVRQIDKLLDLGITHVLTANAMPRAELDKIRLRLQNVGISHHAVGAHDENGYDILGLHWEECKKVFEDARDHPDGKLVVHCVAGMNRSGVLAAAAMLTIGDRDNNDNTLTTSTIEDSKKPTLLDVIKALKRKRGMVMTNLSFQKQLCELAGREGRLGEKPLGYNDDPLPASNFCRFGPSPNEALDRLWS